ncbi:MAG: protein-disulfide reductase DsbD family protein [Planctomycetota bacterium]
MQLLRLLSFAVALSLATLTSGQDFGEVRIEVAGRMQPPSAGPGDTVELVVTVTPVDGWHVYGGKEEGAPTTLKLVETHGLVAAGKASVPDGAPHRIGSLTSYWLDQPFEIKQRLTVPPSTPPGDVVVEFQVDHMACTPEFCDPPASAPGQATLKVGPGSGAQAPTASEFQDERIAVEARFDPPRVPPDGKTTLVLRVTPAIGWHVYGTKEETGKPIELAKMEGKGIERVGGEQVPEGVKHALGSEDSYWLEDPFEIRQPVHVVDDAAAGEIEVEVTIGYMACTPEACDPPTTLVGKVTLAVDPGAAPAPVPAPSAADQIPSASLLPLLLAAIAAGLFALVMPCTYPMIPITISFFTKQASARGSSAVGLSLLYGLGIVAMFVLIGVLVGEPIQRFAANPVFNLIVAVLFVVFGVSLLGLVNLEPPRALMNLAGQASRQGGFFGVFLMGALLVVTSFTCTAPVIGGLLGGSATLGGSLVTVSRGQIALAMTVFGLTMALPFVFLSLVPGRLKSMPRSGEWMNTLKVFFGFVELAAALKFVSNADLVWQWQSLPREVFLWLWAALFGVAALYLLGIVKLKGEDGSIGPGRLVSGLGTMMFAAYCVFGALGNPLDFVMTAFAPNYSVTVGGGAGGGGGAKLHAQHEVIADDHTRALQVAKEQGKLLFINFTGFT